MENSTANRDNELPAELEFEKQLGQLTNYHRIMRQAGLHSTEVMQMSIDRPDIRKRIVEFCNGGGYIPSRGERNAREIMGDNYVGVEEGIKLLGINPAKYSPLGEIALDEKTLERYRDTHLLVAVFPKSINLIGMWKLVLEKRALEFDEQRTKQPFAKECGGTEWWLVRKTILPNSTNMEYFRQRVLLPHNEVVPPARVMVYAAVCHFMATGERLFPDGQYARCDDDLDNELQTAAIGNFRECQPKLYPNVGLSIVSFDKKKPYSSLGLASGRVVG